jgi:WD40 repeat protein
VRSLAWHPNGSLLAGAVSGTVIFWNASTGSTSNTISTGFTVYSIAINKAGTSMLVAGSGGSSPKMELWDISSTPYKRTISFSPTSCAVVVYHTSFSPDSTMATAACPGAAYVWKVSTQQQVAKVTKSGYYFYTAGLTPDNKILAVGGRQSGSAGHLYLYNITGPTPSQIFVDTTTHSNYLWSLSFRP